MQDEQGRGASAKRKPRSGKRSRTRETCFVIMPFGGWGDDYFDTIYRPAIEAAGLETHRADDLFRPSTIVNDIWAYTKRARLLLADLSGKNPNVFYELGLAHALAKPVILVAESMDEIPFDLRALRVITYDKHDPGWGRNLRGKVEAAVKEVLKSPLEAVLPAFLEVKSDKGKPQVTAHEKELIEIKQELDLLKREVRSRRLGEGLTSEQGWLFGAAEARVRIRDYAEMGLPGSEIVRRLTSRGIPARWVWGELRRVKLERVRARIRSRTRE
jgi:hypothetical protein